MSNLSTKDYLFFAKNIDFKTPVVSIKKNGFDENQSIHIPGSKSMTNRALTLVGMEAKPVTLSGILFAEDSYWGLLALQHLGFLIECDETTHSVLITPPCKKDYQNKTLNRENRIQSLFLGKAGTLARFFPAIILNWEKTFPNSAPLTATLDGEEQLRKRPLQDLLVALKKLGGNISSHTLPATLTSSSLQGECEIAGNISGQFLSGLLLAAFGSKNKIKIHRTENLVQPDYIKMTLNMIHEFGGNISSNKELTTFTLLPREAQNAPLDYYEMEADASTACYFICLSYLHNFNLHIENLGRNTQQPDYQFVYLLQKMGANIIVQDKQTTILKQNPITQKTIPQKIDCSAYSDQALTIGIISLFSHEPVEVYGISHIRKHESDRIAGLVKNLTALECEAYEKPDGFIVYPTKKNPSEICGIWETFGDHRFVMAGFLLASLCPQVKIAELKSVEKTAPLFFEQAEALGFKIKESQ